MLQKADEISFEGILRPVRVSVMLDANGCNTTAAAAVVAASRHISLRNATACARWNGSRGTTRGTTAALDGAKVTLTSRTQTKADSVCAEIQNRVQDAPNLTGMTSKPFFRSPFS